MWWFLQAGIVAARRQIAAMVILALFWLGYQNYFVQDAAASLCSSSSQFLVWAYLLVAAGVAMTSTRSVHMSAKFLNRAYRIVHEPRRLIFQFGLISFLFATFALRMPPDFIVNIGGYFSCVGAASIVWAATMSIGVASFGASAHGALKALRGERAHRN